MSSWLTGRQDRVTNLLSNCLTLPFFLLFPLVSFFPILVSFCVSLLPILLHVDVLHPSFQGYCRGIMLRWRNKLQAEHPPQTGSDRLDAQHLCFCTTGIPVFRQAFNASKKVWWNKKYKPSVYPSRRKLDGLFPLQDVFLYTFSRLVC